MKYNFEPIQNSDEADLFYSPFDEESSLGCIGHLRMDFGSGGKEFHVSWFDHVNKEMNDSYFKQSFDNFINSARGDVLKNRESMSQFCHSRNESRRIQFYDGNCWGFRVFTDKYAFYLRCQPTVHDYDAYCYCYDKEKLIHYLAVKHGMPTHCYSELPSTGETIRINFLEKGYYPTEIPGDETVDSINKMLGVTPAQKLAMECGSMFGWDAPGADPQTYDKTNMTTVKIYQINPDRDKNRVSFMNHESLQKWQGTPDVDSGIYDMVYEGEVAEASLEGIYRVFNLKHPTDFTGHSLSVSDVVEVVKSDNIEPGFYFCDSFGFKKIDFNAEAARQGQESEPPNLIRVLVVEPGKEPYEKHIEPGLESLQHEVGGDIEAVYPFEEEVALICDEEGKLSGKDLNRALRDEDGELYDIIAGTFLVADCSGENFGSLSEAQMTEFYAKFKHPEAFFKINGNICVVPIKERKTPKTDKNNNNKDDKGDR